MFDTKFWEEIKTNYPEAYKEFYDLNVKNDIQIFDNAFGKIKGLQNICYCKLETYFRKKEIIIYTTCAYDYSAWNHTVNKHTIYGCKSIEIAQLSVVKRAFEIRNNQLKEVK